MPIAAHTDSTMTSIFLREFMSAPRSPQRFRLPSATTGGPWHAARRCYRNARDRPTTALRCSHLARHASRTRTGLRRRRDPGSQTCCRLDPWGDNGGMDLGLGGRVYLVTGGSRGLGFAAADALVAEGASVVLSSPHEATVAAAAARLLEN